MLCKRWNQSTAHGILTKRLQFQVRLSIHLRTQCKTDHAEVQLFRADLQGQVRAATEHANVEEGGQGQQWWCVEVTHTGPGMSEEACQNMQEFFSSTTKQRSAGYGYSKAHGAQYSGQGVGMPMTALYVKAISGQISCVSHMA
jgi:signal transduction histidine kinase